MKFARFNAKLELIARFDSNINPLLDDHGQLKDGFTDLVPMPEDLFWQSVNESGLWKLNDSNGEISKHPPPLPTSEQLTKQLTDAVQDYMETTAQARGYDSLLSVISYADEPAVRAFQTEGLAFRAWRSKVWETCNQLRADVLAGTAPIPTVAELLKVLPEVQK